MSCRSCHSRTPDVRRVRSGARDTPRPVRRRRRRCPLRRRARRTLHPGGDRGSRRASGPRTRSRRSRHQGPGRGEPNGSIKTLPTAARTQSPKGLNTARTCGSPPMPVIDREEILEVLETYDASKIRIATIGSHSALDVCDGSIEEGFPTLVICEKGRATPYARYFRTARDKEGRAIRGVVDDAIVLSKFQEVLTGKIQERLRRANA